MITVEELAELFNREITDKFMEEMCDRWQDGDNPIDPDSPEMEVVLEKVADSLNEVFPIEDDYV